MPSRFFNLHKLFPFLLLALAALAAYANVYDNGFVFDDELLISGNAWLKGEISLLKIFSTPLTGGAGVSSNFYRPMQTLVYVAVRYLSGDGTLGFHVLNVVLHATNAVLLLALARAMNFSGPASFFGALIWAVHPLHSEAIAYMSGTADPLSVFFMLSGLLLIARRQNLLPVMAATGLMALALLSKESAVVMPALACLVLYAKNETRFKRSAYGATAPLWFLFVIYAVLHATVLDFNAPNMDFSQNPVAKDYATNVLVRLYTALATLPLYLFLIVAPVHLHMERAFPVYPQFFMPDVLAGAALVAGAALHILLGRGKRGVALSFGLLWFAVALSPMTGIVRPAPTLFLEHWMYLPLAGLLPGLAETLAQGVRSRWERLFLGSAGTLVAVVFCLMTLKQNTIWHSAFTFYPHILKYENSMRAHTNLGKAHLDAGRVNLALEHFDAALKINPMLPEIHQNIASAHALMPGWKNHPRRVIGPMEKALSLDPHFTPACIGLSWAWGELGDVRKKAYYDSCVARLKLKYLGRTH